MKDSILQINGEYVLPMAREQVWSTLNDPEVLTQCIYGCERVTKLDGHHFKAVFGWKLGPVKKRYEATLQVLDKGAPAQYLLAMKMKTGLVGEVLGQADVQLIEHQSTTVLRYHATAELNARFARFKIPMLQRTAERAMHRFIERVLETVRPDPSSGS